MNVIKKVLSFSLVMLIFSFGCVTIKKPLPEMVKPTPQLPREMTIVAHDVLKKRIEGLADRISEYQALEKQLTKEGKGDSKVLADLRQGQRLASDLIETYRKIEEFQGELSGYQSRGMASDAYRRILETLFQGLTRLDDGYFRDGYKVRFGEKEFLKKHEFDIKELEGYCLHKDYVKIIEFYEKVKARYGRELIPANISLCYANALSHMNRVEEAIEVAQGVIDESPPDSLEVRSNLIDWYLMRENVEKARQNLEKLSDDMDRKMAALEMTKKRVASPLHRKLDKPMRKLFGDHIIEEDIKPADDTAREVKAVEGVKEVEDVEKDEVKKESPEEVEEDRKTNLGEGLERAHGLVNERRFEEARAILLELKGRIDNPQEIEAVENELEILKREEETTKEEEEKESFLMANKLIESEKYEKAITELTKLKESTTYSQESQQMIERAIDEFAGKKRQEAAKLFLMAKNTTDLTEKKRLLVRSLELLREVMEKYPANSYSEKITKNIETVKEEILKIDPQFSEKAPEPDAEVER